MNNRLASVFFKFIFSKEQTIAAKNRLELGKSVFGLVIEIVKYPFPRIDRKENFWKKKKTLSEV